MNKSTLIATCLVNSGMIKNDDSAEQAVRQVFHDEFPSDSFDQWNSKIDDKRAREIIGSVGRASRINVRNFIKDLW